MNTCGDRMNGVRTNGERTIGLNTPGAKMNGWSTKGESTMGEKMTGCKMRGERTRGERITGTNTQGERMNGPRTAGVKTTFEGIYVQLINYWNGTDRRKDHRGKNDGLTEGGGSQHEWGRHNGRKDHIPPALQCPGTEFGNSMNLWNYSIELFQLN